MIRYFLHIIFLSLLCSLSSTIFAATNQHVPDDLMFNGKPIDPLCFFNLDKYNINLKDCGAKHEKFTLKSIDPALSKKGYIGYDWQDPKLSALPQGYSYYRFFPAGNHEYWIYSVNNSGGSGEFNNLYIVKRTDKNTLSVQAIIGGDRCNGGIQDVTAKNDKLTFSVNHTPYDLIALSKEKIKDLKAYDDLAACAVCCAAKAFYTVDRATLKSQHYYPQFNYVELGKVTNTDEMPTQGKYQECFNKLFISYVNKNETKLDQKKIDEFARQFKQDCISKK